MFRFRNWRLARFCSCINTDLFAVIGAREGIDREPEVPARRGIALVHTNTDAQFEIRLVEELKFGIVADPLSCVLFLGEDIRDVHIVDGEEQQPKSVVINTICNVYQIYSLPLVAPDRGVFILVPRGSEVHIQFSQEVRDEDPAKPDHARDPYRREDGVQRFGEGTVVARLDGGKVDEDAEADSENE
jgi:hypothetical protein